MPIYKFRCPDCLKEEEAILPMANRNDARIHSCGAVMERLMSPPAPATFPETGRDKVLKTLNKEGGYALPTQPSDRPRMERAMAKGLDQTRLVVGKGF